MITTVVTGNNSIAAQFQDDFYPLNTLFVEENT